MAVQASSAGPGRWRVALGILTILFTAVLVIVLNTLMIDLPTRKRAAYDVASSAGNKSTAGKARILSVPSFRPISIRRVRGQNMSSPRTVRRRSSEVDEIPSGHRERLLRDLGVGSALSVNGSWSSGDASSLPSFPFTARLGVSTSCVNPETLSWGKWAFPPRVVQPLYADEVPVAVFQNVLVGAECAGSRVRAGDVVVTTHASVDRLPLVTRLIRRWRGCVSLAVVLCSSSEVDTLRASVATLGVLADYLILHVAIAALDPPTVDHDGKPLRGPRRPRSPYPGNILRNAAAEPWQRAWDATAPWSHRQWTRVDPGAPPLPAAAPEVERGTIGKSGVGSNAGILPPWQPPTEPPPPPLNVTLAAWPRYCPAEPTGADTAAAAALRAREAEAAGLWGSRSSAPWLLVVDADSLVSVTADTARRLMLEAMGPAAEASVVSAVAAARVAWQRRSRAAALNASIASPPPWPDFEAEARLHARWDLGNVMFAIGAVAVAQRPAPAWLRSYDLRARPLPPLSPPTGNDDAASDQFPPYVDPNRTFDDSDREALAALMEAMEAAEANATRAVALVTRMLNRTNASALPPPSASSAQLLSSQLRVAKVAAEAAKRAFSAASDRYHEAASRRSRRLERLWHHEAAPDWADKNGSVISNASSLAGLRGIAGAFAAVDPDNATAAREWLAAAASRREVEVFHAGYFPAAYAGRLPVVAWLSGTPMLPASFRFSSRFEPYFVFRPPAPRFDEAYRGRGYNKSGYWATLGLPGWVRLVFLPELWVWCGTSADEPYRTGRSEAQRYYWRAVRRLVDRGHVCARFSKEDWEVAWVRKEARQQQQLLLAQGAATGGGRNRTARA